MDEKFKALLSAIPAYRKRMYKKHRQVVDAVSDALLENRLMQKEIAERMGVDEASLSRMLSAKGANMTLETIGKIEEALGEDILTSAAEVKEAIAHNLEEARALYQEAKRNASRVAGVAKVANDTKKPRIKQAKVQPPTKAKPTPTAVPKLPRAERVTSIRHNA